MSTQQTVPDTEVQRGKGWQDTRALGNRAQRGERWDGEEDRGERGGDTDKVTY